MKTLDKNLRPSSTHSARQRQLKETPAISLNREVSRLGMEDPAYKKDQPQNRKDFFLSDHFDELPEDLQELCQNSDHTATPDDGLDMEAFHQSLMDMNSSFASLTMEDLQGTPAAALSKHVRRVSQESIQTGPKPDKSSAYKPDLTASAPEGLDYYCKRRVLPKLKTLFPATPPEQKKIRVRIKKKEKDVKEIDLSQL